MGSAAAFPPYLEETRIMIPKLYYLCKKYF